MALATIPWRGARTNRRRGVVVAAKSPVVAEQRLERLGFLAADWFFDIVVLACVLMFMVLAIGVALLALPVTLRL